MIFTEVLALSDTPLQIDFPEGLPVSARREEIMAAMDQHQVIIVCGETGSGKTTQLPKIALMLGRGKLNAKPGERARMIGHTQPRRIAASSVAKRIAEELKTPLGEVVGFKVRFQDRLGKNASVKLMTDGILLAETQTDPLLQAYDTLIIDEAHERSLNIDFLAGLPAPDPAAQAGPQDRRHLGHHRRRPLCQTLCLAQRPGTGHHGLRPHLPGGAALPPV